MNTKHSSEKKPLLRNNDCKVKHQNTKKCIDNHLYSCIVFFSFVIAYIFFQPARSALFSVQSRWCLVSQHRYCSTLGLLNVLLYLPGLICGHILYLFTVPYSPALKLNLTSLYALFSGGVICKNVYDLVLQ